MSEWLLHSDWIYLIFILVGIITGIINTLAGGGSILTLPLLIFIGLPPAMANGTNRLGVFLQTFTGAVGFRSKGINMMPHGLYWGISAMMGSVIGAQLAVDIKGETFNRILGVVILLVVVFTLYQPKKINGISERISGKYFWISLIAFFFIGIFGGFIQAGTGFFILLVLTQINRLNLIKSNALKSIIVAVYTLAAIMVFIYHHQINWLYGSLLAIGQSAGAWFSSRWSVQKDDKLIRIFLIIVSLGMAVKLWFF